MSIPHRAGFALFPVMPCFVPLQCSALQSPVMQSRAITNLAVGVFICGAPTLFGQATSGRTVRTCNEATLARPDRGVAYRGRVQNSDYRLAVTIPDGLVGWGAAPEAPFHGFTIFLNSGRTSCIIFEVHLHVELPEDRNAINPSDERGHRIDVGNRRGWQLVESGQIGGSTVTNVNIALELPRRGYVNDANIT